jgi:release factor glutamine methyltransferase
MPHERMPTTTLLEVLRRSTRYLADHGSPSARLDAELLTAHALGLRRLDVYLQHDRPLREEELVPMRELVRRRGKGEPVAYLVGEREFWSRPFRVTPDVLIPRPETELVVERALPWARHRAGAHGGGLRIADLGTGSGCLAVTLAVELQGARVWATDVSTSALAVAEENARRLGTADRVHFLEGPWGAPLRDLGQFDVIVTNPPYVATSELDGLMQDVRDHEPRLALDGGEDGLDAYRALLPDVSALLSPAAAFLLEVDPTRAARVVELVAEALPATAVEIHADLAGHDRVVEALRA